MARRKAAHIPYALLDQLLAGADPKSAFEADGLLDGLKKALAERALNAEMDHHLTLRRVWWIRLRGGTVGGGDRGWRGRTWCASRA